MHVSTERVMYLYLMTVGIYGSTYIGDTSVAVSFKAHG